MLSVLRNVGFIICSPCRSRKENAGHVSRLPGLRPLTAERIVYFIIEDNF